MNNTTKEDIRQNRLNLIDSILRQNDDGIVSSNGHDNDFVLFNGDHDSDEYALTFLFSFASMLSVVFFFFVFFLKVNFC